MTNYLTPLSEHLEVDQLLASFTCLHGHDVDTSFELRDCEICGSREFFELRPAVDIGQGQLAAIPYSACCKCGHVMQNPTFAPSFFSEFYKLQYHHQRKISVVISNIMPR